MTREEIDSVSFDDTITTGSNQTLEVETGRADDVLILIDNGTTDNQPAQYTMIERVYTDEQDDYQFYDQVSGETARSWTDPAWGEKMQFEFNNTSGGDSNYRITIKSYRNMD